MILYLQSALLLVALICRSRLFFEFLLVKLEDQSQTIHVWSLKVFLQEMRCGHTHACFLNERTVKVKAVRLLICL